MEEQSSWKGHTFTLLVFTGIVFLCSVFFVLGMLVGESHSRSVAEAATAAAAAKAATAAATEAPHSVSESASVIAPYEGVETGRAANTGALSDEPASAAPAREVIKPPSPPTVKPAPPVAAALVPKPAPVPASVKMNYLQVNAFGKESAARKLVDELVKKGFPALFTNGSADKLYHVQVGPFSNGTDEETAKSKLEALGYHVIKK